MSLASFLLGLGGSVPGNSTTHLCTPGSDVGVVNSQVLRQIDLEQLLQVDSAAGYANKCTGGTEGVNLLVEVLCLLARSHKLH